MKLLLSAIAVILLTSLNLQTAQAEDEQFSITLNLFIKKGDAQCKAAEAELKKRAKNKGIRYRVVDISNSPEDEAYFKRIANFYKVPQQVPFVYGCNQVVFGYEEKKFQSLLDDMLKIQIFVKDNCKECEQMKKYINNTFKKEYPGFTVQTFHTTKQAFSQDWLKKAWKTELSGKRQATPAAPAYFVCRDLSSFDDIDSMKAQLKKSLSKWTTKIEK